MTEAELQGTTWKPGEKEQPVAQSVLASLWRRKGQIALCDVGSARWDLSRDRY